MKSLRDIFYNLPKFADKWDPYFDVYETWFSKFRDQSPRILEIGVQNGGSAQMWLEYFGPGTKVAGVDIDPRCKQHAADNIEIIISNQGSSAFWNNFFKEHTEPFDIIIDDGGHRMQEMILTFSVANTHVKDNGIYLVEDLHTAYWNHSSLFLGPWDDFGLYNPRNMMEFTKVGLDVLNNVHINPHKDIIPQIDTNIVNTFKHVKGVHYYNSIIVFEIGPQKEFKRCLNSGRTMT